MSGPIVCVKQGKLLGRVCKNLHNGDFYSFQGIPYAKPPLKSLRFKVAQPAEPWSGVRDATKEANECYSRKTFFTNIVGSEDCLYLNVYTPNLDEKKLKPVMFWIHGGAFRGGSSKTETFGPEYLMTEDVVLVTINYRLGLLGFLHLKDPSLEVPGNVALKDMVLALKWVQQNIDQFGGDPNNVTIFGESAGAASVHYLVLSPLAKGLFHKAIAQSGTAINPFATGRSDIVDHIANILQIKSDNEKEILEKLQVLPIEKLFEISESIDKKCESMHDGEGRLTYAPIVEPPSGEAFISEQPIKIIRSGNYNHVPIIFGYTSDEGMLIELKIRPHKPRMPPNFEKIIPFTLGVKPGSEIAKLVAEKIKKFYYAEAGSEDKVDNFYKIHTDNVFLREIIVATELHAAKSKCPIYLYRMSIDTNLNLVKKLTNLTNPGVCHGDDIGYLFKTAVSPSLEKGSLEEISVKRFVKYWTNFAKSGNPNLPNEELKSTEWKPVTKTELNYIDIGTEVKAGTDPDADRVKFWKDIFSINPLYKT